MFNGLRAGVICVGIILATTGHSVAQTSPAASGAQKTETNEAHPANSEDKWFNLFQGHLNVITLILGIAATIAIAAQLVIQFRDYRNQLREKAEEKRREQASQKRIQRMERAFGKYLGSTATLIKSMNSMINLHSETLKARDTFDQQTAKEQSERTAEAEKVNREAEDFFRDWARLSPGFHAQLERVNRSFDESISRFRINPEDLKSYVLFARANYEAVIRGDNSGAVVLFGKILTKLDIADELAARAYYQRGLSLELLREQDDATKDFERAYSKKPENLLYQFSVARAKLLSLRGGAGIDIEALKKDFEQIDEILRKQKENAKTGKMDLRDFHNLFGYWYASFLTYEVNTPDSADKAISILDGLGAEDSAVSAVRYSALKRCDHSSRHKPPTIEMVERALNDCNEEINDTQGDRALIPLLIRAGRWHKVLADMSGDFDRHKSKMEKFAHRAQILIRRLQSKLGVREAIYNPISRHYDTFDDLLASVQKDLLLPSKLPAGGPTE